MLGDAYLRANKPADAAKAYQTAIKLEPVRSSLIRMSLGRALLASGDAKGALKVLQQGISYDQRSPDGYEALAMAYGQLGKEGEALLATAEMNYYSGQLREAKMFALRAQARLPQTSPEWRRAQDIVSQK